jgi:hypothetical protein
METDTDLLTGAISPLEAFLRDYAEVSGGLWDEIEPQVYDLMLPGREPGADEPEVVRVAFDPEAIPEHPGAQLASFGTPLIDRLLADAVERGRHAQLYYTGLSASTHGLAGRVSRALTLPEGSTLRIQHARAMHFPQAVFWFQATFISDQKEQDLLPVAIDLHHGRQVRHLDRLLDRSHLAEEPWTSLPEARHAGLASAYPIARERVVRTLAALANTRARELGERLGRQVERMRRYYADLRAEVEEQAERVRNRSEDPAKFAARREALDREEQLRVAELRQKSSLWVHLRLVNLLEIHQPKLLLRTSVLSGGSAASPLELVWDLLVDALEAIPCPDCGQPTFALEIIRQGRITCPTCAARAAAQARARR